MIELEKINSKYTVRRIEEKDIEEVYQLYLGNPMYFEYCPPEPSLEMVYSDMIAVPSRKNPKDKYFVGYYDNDELVAVMDLVDRYPNAETGYIGFFMVLKKLQGNGLGSKLIEELSMYLKESGFKYMKLGYVEGNKQAENFWKKNGFNTIERIADCREYKLVMVIKEL